jgi:hypothetical protein
MKVEVTQQHIDSAEKRVSSHCMVSVAIKDKARQSGLPYGRISTDVQTIRYSNLDTDQRFVFFTPRAVQIAIARFDAGIPVPPFSFVLDGKRAAQVTSVRHWGEREKARYRKQGRRAKMKRSVAIRIQKNKKGQIMAMESPRVTGGRTPPVVPRGTRRLFGLRGLSPDSFLQFDGLPKG